MTRDLLKVGIAGHGVVGKIRHRFINEHPDLRVIAVCDVRFTNPTTEPDGVRCWNDYRQLLDEPLDILFVCLPNYLAPEVTIAGLQSGFHVFCEKPPGRDLDDLYRVMAAEREHSQLKLMYGFNHRYHDSVRDALSIIQSGELGRVIDIRGVYGKSKIIRFNSDWRTKRAMAGGGILLDQGIHMVDLIRLFGGEFNEVHSFINNGFWKHDVEDNAYALMKSETGVIAMLHSSATQWRHRFDLHITLSAGAIILSGLLTASKSYGAETITLVHPSENDEGDPREQTTRYNQDHSWRDEISDFADRINNNKPIEFGCSREALRTMELVYRIYCADPEWRSTYDLCDQPRLRHP